MTAGHSANVIELDVQGMTCASCAARIQKKLNKLDGVQASVNYATEKAHVLAPDQMGADELIETIRKAGYDASLPVPDAAPVDRAGQIRRRLIVCAILAIPVVAMAMIPIAQFPGWQWLSLILATPVVTWGAWPFHKSALVNLRHGATTMDTLISLGTSSAYLFSLVAMLIGQAGQIGMTHHWTFALTHDHHLSSIYFEAACGIIVFILLGRFIEARSRQDASLALKALAEVGAKSVVVLRDGVEVAVPIEALGIGDEFVVRPGEKVATDGIVVDGVSAVDNSIITGESVPVEVSEGSAVVGASVNTVGRLVVRATAVGSGTQLAQIANLVEQAQTGKSRSQALADAIAGVFVPIVIGLAALTVVIWLLLGESLSFAITAGVCVLIISCPCALGLATPTALLAGSLRGSQLGIVIRGPHALEAARGVDVIAMDKTGTITTGQMTVTQTLAAPGVDVDDLMGAVAGVESGSEHPIAQALVRHADSSQIAPWPIAQFENLPGRGVRARSQDRVLAAGSAALMADLGVQIPDEIRAAADRAADQGASVVYGARDAQLLGALCVADRPAPGAVEAIARLRALGLRTVMLTGDNARAATHIASEVGVDEVRSEVLPADKFEVIRSLQSDGNNAVAMIGDGVNDAAALAQADLGIAMGSGTDAAIAVSDLTLMRHDLGLAVDAIALSRRVLRTIHGNLFWAFIYNICAIPVAALGYLNPMFAGAAMAFSSVFVVTNSLRLRHYSPAR